MLSALDLTFKAIIILGAIALAAHAGWVVGGIVAYLL